MALEDHALKLPTRAELVLRLKQVDNKELVILLGPDWTVTCVRLDKTILEGNCLAFRSVRESTAIAEVWRLGSVDDLHAYLVSLWAYLWTGVAAGNSLREYTVKVTETHAYVFNAPSVELAVHQALEMRRSGLDGEACEKVRVHATKWAQPGVIDATFSMNDIDATRALAQIQAGERLWEKEDNDRD